MNDNDKKLIEEALTYEPEHWFSVVALMAKAESDECLVKLSDILSSLYNKDK